MSDARPPDGHAAAAPPAAPPRRRVGGRYSVFVDLMRYLLPATALLLIVLVLLWPYLMGTYSQMIMPIRDAGDLDAGNAMRMARPHYVGRTSDDQPYTVTADNAQLDPERPNLIRLDNLDAQLTTADARDLTLRAQQGIYRRNTERLRLFGGIELTSSDGYRFETESARVDLARGTVVGPRPVQGTGPTGDLEASRFEIRDGGDVLRFEGRVKVTLQPQRTAGPRESGT
ncbi:MAG TPA: LPS export ABC transporter periplasmic protein LptC [Geminicoccaceae bacterium]|nr:LPS export ABC transporter periplasmic protein LptC [Geminicoccaceae bacterium]